jgi:hypothetical protein
MRVLSLGVKRPGCEVYHSSPSSAEVKECVELYLHFPNTTSWHGAQLKTAQGRLYLYLYLLTFFVKETGWEDVDWINLTEDREQWRALVNTVMKLQVP